MIVNLILWVDASPWRFWTVAFVVLGAFLYSAAAPIWRGSDATFPLAKATRFFGLSWPYLILGALAILVFRVPSILYPRLLAPDEAQMASQAMRYLTDMIPWRGVDGTTSGPLNSWWLILPTLLGAEISWATVRLMAFLCVAGTFSLTYATLRQLTDEVLARAVLVPMVFFYAFCTSEEFLHYSSEHVPMLLAAGAVFFIVKAWRTETFSLPLVFFAALCLGALPFAKLQAGPMGAYGGVVLLVLVWTRSRSEGGRPGRGILAWLAGGALVPALMLGLMIGGGSLNDFMISYVGHVQSFRELDHPGNSLARFLRTDPQQSALIVGAAVMGIGLLACSVGWQRGAAWRLSQPLPWILGYLLVAVFCVLWSGKNFPHYFHLWIGPIFLVHALLAAAVFSSTPKIEASESLAARGGWFCALPLMAAQVTQLFDVAAGHSWIGETAKFLGREKDPVVRVIEQIARPGDRLAIWGMTPSYCVDSGLVQGTRDGIAQMQILEHSKQAYYRNRFLEDLKASGARIFVDSDSPFLMVWGGTFLPYLEKERHGHEDFPELADYVRRNYTKVQDMPIGQSGHSIRIYIRN